MIFEPEFEYYQIILYTLCNYYQLNLNTFIVLVALLHEGRK